MLSLGSVLVFACILDSSEVLKYTYSLKHMGTKRDSALIFVLQPN